GIPNLETVTGSPFAELYRNWTVALFLSGLDPHAPPDVVGSARGPEGERPDGYGTIDLRGPVDGWVLAGPRPVEIVASGIPHVAHLTGPSSQYVVIEPPGSGATALTIRVSGPAEADLQVTAIPLPDRMARLALTTRVGVGTDGTRLLHAQLRE